MDNEQHDWRGRVAVITGSGGGIGLAIAVRLGRAGMNVVLADRDADRLHDAASHLRAAGAPNVLTVVCDVTNAASMDALAATVREQLGDVHVLCNNAGAIRPGRVWEASLEDWNAVFAVNVLGLVNGLRAFVPGMLAHGQPSHVINTASGAGLYVAPSFAAYSTSKAAAVALTESLAAEVAEIPGVRMRVSALCPGSVTSNLFRDEVARRVPDAASDVPLGEVSRERWATVSSPERTDQMDPGIVADHVWDALQDGRFWILPIQPGMLGQIKNRTRALSTALASTSPVDDPSTLRRYFAAVDEGRSEDAVALLHPGLQFRFARPDGAIEGTRDDLAGYLAARRPLGHRLARVAADGDVELALGDNVDGDRSIGTFVAAMRTDADGRIDRYLAALFPETDGDGAPQ